jgi:hypothetical protein
VICRSSGCSRLEAAQERTQPRDSGEAREQRCRRACRRAPRRSAGRCRRQRRASMRGSRRSRPQRRRGLRRRRSGGHPGAPGRGRVRNRRRRGDGRGPHRASSESATETGTDRQSRSAQEFEPATPWSRIRIRNGDLARLGRDRIRAQAIVFAGCSGGAGSHRESRIARFLPAVTAKRLQNFTPRDQFVRALLGVCTWMSC